MDACNAYFLNSTMFLKYSNLDESHHIFNMSVAKESEFWGDANSDILAGLSCMLQDSDYLACCRIQTILHAAGFSEAEANDIFDQVNTDGGDGVGIEEFESW
jgi:hypothetical protein